MKRAAFILLPLFWAPLPALHGAWEDIVAHSDEVLTAEQRLELIQHAATGNNWKKDGEAITVALAQSATNSTSSPEGWRDRLHLANAFIQLGTNETVQAADYLAGRIRAKGGQTLSPQNIEEALKQPVAARALLAVLGPEDNLPKPDILANRFTPASLQAVLEQPALVNQLSSTLEATDYVPGAWRTIVTLQEKFASDLPAFVPLSVAVAVVHDVPPPPQWPHHQVDARSVPFESDNAVEVFGYFVDQAKAGNLLLDPRKLKTEQLKFLVDVPVKLDDLLWAARTIRKSRGNFDDVFAMVKYDTRRAEMAQYEWPENIPYTLPNILDKSGICVDQAYFAFLAGKARGLPTLYFSGQGSDGGHAWFGYLKTDEKWEMDAGRYLNQKYVTGEARDPQSWLAINDHQLKFISRRLSNVDGIDKSNELVLLAGLTAKGSGDASRIRLLDDARRVCPDNADAWTASAKALKDAGDTSRLKALYEAMAVQFASEADIRTQAQQELVALASGAGEKDSAQSLQQNMVRQNKNKRSDLGITAAAEILEQRLSARDYDGAMSEYKSSLRRFQADGGGNLFYDLVRPFILALHRDGQSEKAAKALEIARERMFPSPDSILDRDLITLGMAIGMKDPRAR